MTVIVIYEDECVSASECTDFKLDMDMGVFFLDRNQCDISGVYRLVVDGVEVFKR